MKKINFSQLVDIIDMSNASIDPYLLSLPSPKLSYSYLCAQGVCVAGYYIGTLTKLGWCAAHLWRENGARRKISGCAAQIGAIGCAAQDRRNEGAPILRGAMKVRRSCAAHPRNIHRERSLPICKLARCTPLRDAHLYKTPRNINRAHVGRVG